MKKGSISVFLSLILIPVIVLVMSLLESVRYRGMILMANQAGYAACDSVFAGYDRSTFDRYGLLFYDGGFGLGLTQYEKIEEEFCDWFEKNTMPSLQGGSFFRMERPQVKVTKIVHATDYSGSIFVSNALAAYPFEKAGDLLDTVTKDLGIIREHEIKELPGIKPDIPGIPPGGELYGAGRRFMKEFSEKAGVGKNTNEEGNPGKEYKDLLNSGLVGQSNEIRKKGWLSLVLPKERTISGYQFSISEFPSETAVDDRKVKGSTFLQDEAKKAVFNEYLMDHFSCFIDGERIKEGIQYELEYILFHQDSDEKNLKKTLNTLLLAREGLNLSVILSSEKIKTDIKLLAFSMVGWTGIAALLPIAEALITGAYCYAESLCDIKTLLSGNKVPLLKKETDFHLSLESAGSFFNGEAGNADEVNEGLGYRDYLRLFLFAESINDLSYRAMDMIQYEYSERGRTFFMMSQVYAMEFKVSVTLSPLFTMFPFVRGLAGIPKDRMITLYFSKSYD